jgi:hypothetical protein
VLFNETVALIATQQISFYFAIKTKGFAVQSPVILRAIILGGK